MNGATVTALLVAAFVAAGTVLVILEETAVGVFVLCVAAFGLLVVMAMTFSDAKSRAGALPPPKA